MADASTQHSRLLALCDRVNAFNGATPINLNNVIPGRDHLLLRARQLSSRIILNA